MTTILVGLGASLAITLAMMGGIWRDNRRARRECQRWFDEHVRPAGKIDLAGDVLQ